MNNPQNIMWKSQVNTTKHIYYDTCMSIYLNEVVEKNHKKTEYISF